MKWYSTSPEMKKKNHTDTGTGSLGVDPFYGLSIFVDPPQAEVDIIAVHGLNGHYQRSWTNPFTKKIWLRDFLPDDIPLARVMSFSYDAQVISHSVETLNQKAEALLRAIKRKRDDNKSRPLILIGHSLGGILIKQALVNAGNRYPYIVQATIGVVFMAVPHTGADITKWVDTVTTIAAPFIPTWNFRKETAPLLRKDSPVLVQLAMDFDQLSGFKVLAVNEAATTPALLGLRCHVVPATGLHVGKTGTTIAVTGANHHTVCKFASSSNEFYQDVCSWLNEVINESLRGILAVTPSPATPKGHIQIHERGFDLNADAPPATGQENEIRHLQLSASVLRWPMAAAASEIQHRTPCSTGNELINTDSKGGGNLPSNPAALAIHQTSTQTPPGRLQNYICSFDSHIPYPANWANHVRSSSPGDLSQLSLGALRPPNDIIHVSRPHIIPKPSGGIETTWIGSPALAQAASANQPDKVRQLLRQACSIDESSGVVWPPSQALPVRICNIPLLAACCAGHVEIVEDVLKAGADANARDVSGRTALHVAVMLSHLDIVKLLIKYGADIYLTDSRGVSVIDLGRMYGSPEVLGVLQQI